MSRYDTPAKRKAQAEVQRKRRQKMKKEGRCFRCGQKLPKGYGARMFKGRPLTHEQPVIEETLPGRSSDQKWESC